MYTTEHSDATVRSIMENSNDLKRDIYLGIYIYTLVLESIG